MPVRDMAHRRLQLENYAPIVTARRAVSHIDRAFVSLLASRPPAEKQPQVARMITESGCLPTQPSIADHTATSRRSRSCHLHREDIVLRRLEEVGAAAAVFEEQIEMEGGDGAGKR
jgi:hypothetical protein